MERHIITKKKGKLTPKNSQKANPYRRIFKRYNSDSKKRFWRKKMIERTEKLIFKKK